MYLVTMGRSGYVLFSTTPEGRAAVGLTDAGIVRLFAPGEQRGEWRTLREWHTSAYSHTDLMLLLGKLPEPERAEDLLASLPPETLG